MVFLEPRFDRGGGTGTSEARVLVLVLKAFNVSIDFAVDGASNTGETSGVTLLLLLKPVVGDVGSTQRSSYSDWLRMGGAGAKRFLLATCLRSGTVRVGDGDVTGVLVVDESAELNNDFSDFARSNCSRLLTGVGVVLRGDFLLGGGTGACSPA